MAWATAIGRAIGFLWALWHLSTGEGNLHVLRPHLRVEPTTMLHIGTRSGWGTVQVALGSMSWIALVRLMSTFGSTVVAGYTIAIRVLLFALMPAYGVGAAASTIVGWFSEVAAVRDVGFNGLRTMSPGFPPYALGMVLEQSFNGAGDTRTPTWMNVFAFWVVQLPLAWWLSQHTALVYRGVFAAVPIAYTALAIVSAVFFRRGA